MLKPGCKVKDGNKNIIYDAHSESSDTPLLSFNIPVGSLDVSLQFGSSLLLILIYT